MVRFKIKNVTIQRRANVKTQSNKLMCVLLGSFQRLGVFYFRNKRNILNTNC